MSQNLQSNEYTCHFQVSIFPWRYNLFCRIIFFLSFEHIRHLHSSIEASDCRVDEASDNSVQDKGQNLKRRRKKDTFSIKYEVCC